MEHAEVEFMNAFVALVCGDRDELDECASVIADMSDRGANPIAFRMYLMLEQGIAAIEGRLVEAEALSIEQWEAWSSFNLPEAITYRGVEQFAVKREQGRLAEISPAWGEYV